MTEPSNFIHLHVHTQYSLLDGAIRLDKLFERVKTFGMKAVAITDHGAMFGVLEFYQKALKAGVKPIIGCECYIAPRRLTDKTPADAKGATHLVLLAKNREGYQNLCKLASVAQLEGFYYKPRIDKEILAAHSRGLIAASACLHGEIPQLLRDGKAREADAAARNFQKLFGEDHFYLEVQSNGIPLQDQINQGILDMSRRLSIPMIATNDCHYLDRTDVRAHEVLLCIQTGKTLNDPNRFQFATDQLYFKSAEEMTAGLGHFPNALENTAVIADQCHIEFDFKTYHFPKFTSSEEKPPETLFEDQVRLGFQKRLALITAKHPETDEKIYQDRLDYEIGVIKEMGFASYFLIVADFIRYARQNGVPVGPGRGSAAGSMVAYSLGITDLDPIAHGLIFERFLNPARISMPDIDVDFCINGREKVFKYVVDRFGGGDYVAQIITFGKLKTRAVIRDVGRALDIPLKDVDAIAKMVPDVLNISLDHALEQEPKLRELAESRPEVDELIRICRILEGLPRHASTHAAGVVIGDQPLVNYLPLYRGKKGEVVTQFDMKHVEEIGLVKFDFLGLRNLTVIENTLTLIRKNGKIPPDLSDLDFSDAATYALLSSGNTTGVFQLESSGMKDLLVRLKPARFDDITALVALYRPGPLDSGMVNDFVERKHGRQTVEYLLPQLAPILEETYGVILYQEQVMKIAGILASYSMSEADGLRKAMGKKIPEIMAQHRERFMKGAIENRLPEDKAGSIFDLMEKFGGYGFNKSHSAAYALIAYQTAYLKAHFPVEFMASLLTSETGSIDAVVKFIDECRKNAVTVLAPDINTGEKTFTVFQDKIRFGLVAVKNVGEGAIDAILEARAASGPFVSLYNFCERVDAKKVNKRVIESLIKCGAFDTVNDNRARCLAALEEALEYGQRIQKEKASPQLGLFDMLDTPTAPLNPPALPMVADWDDRDRLAYEKEALGFYISGHPLGRHRTILDTYATTNARTFAEKADGDMVRIGGMITGVKTIKTKKGDTMAFITTEDLTGTIETTVFSKIYEETQPLLIQDSAVLIEGRIQQDEKSVKLIADKIVAMNEAEKVWAACVHINLDMSRIDREILLALRKIIEKHSGNCRGYLHLVASDAGEAVIAIDDSLQMNPSDELVREVKGLVGYDAVETACKMTPPAGLKDTPVRR